MKALAALLFSAQVATAAQDIPIHYTLKGSGPETLMLIHGYGLHSGIWDQIIDDLAKSYQVLTLDLRGHGQSDKLHEGYSVELFTEDIYQLINHLGIENPTILGWSLGGYIAQYYATHYPLKKLILVCTSPTWVPEQGFPYGSTKEEHMTSYHKLLKTPDEYYEDCVRVNFMDHCTEVDKDPQAERLRAMLHANDKYALAAIIDYFTKEPASLVNNLSQIEAPTLIISGGQDPVSPLEVGQFMHERIKDSVWYQVPCGGHSLVQTRPQEFLRVVKNFIEERDIQESECLTR